MKYVHVHSRAVREAEPGALHYPWVDAASPRAIPDPEERARAAARDHVDRTVAEATEAEAAKRPKGKGKGSEGGDDA